MTAADFATWLRGFLDALEGPPSAAQVEKVREQLARVVAAPTVTIFPLLPSTTPAPILPLPWTPAPVLPSPFYIGDPAPGLAPYTITCGNVNVTH